CCSATSIAPCAPMRKARSSRGSRAATARRPMPGSSTSSAHRATTRGRRAGRPRKSSRSSERGPGMKALFAPVARLMSGRNKVKQLTAGLLFCIPLAVALVASPPGSSTAAIAIMLTFALAVYYMAALLFTTDRAWDDIHHLTHVLSENDLRASELPDPSTISATNRIGRGQMGKVYRALAETHANLAAIVVQAHRSAAVVRAAADQLATGGESLSRRTETEASTLEE